MHIDTRNWSGEGTFTQLLIDRLQQIEAIELVRVEDAPASRSDADYNFISNELFVRFAVRTRQERTRRWGFIPAVHEVPERVMTLSQLDGAFTAMPDVGAPDYADDGMLQYLRAERIIPPYQTRGYKLVELVRIYEAPSQSGTG
jgi:hypothetical protein